MEPCFVWNGSGLIFWPTFMEFFDKLSKPWRKNMNSGMPYADITKPAPHSQNRMEKSCILFDALLAHKKTATCHACSSYSLTTWWRSGGNDAIRKYGSETQSSGTQHYDFNNVHILQCKVPPRLELGSLDSKSKVLTIAPRHPALLKIWVWPIFPDKCDETVSMCGITLFIGHKYI